MAKFPALPLWTDALIGDTYHLSPAEFGAYMRLLIAAWRSPNCDLPTDDHYLGKAIGDPRNWPRLKKTVLLYFNIEGERMTQKRLLRERDFVSAKGVQASAAGRASALKKNNTSSTDAPTPLQRNANENPTPTPIPIPIHKKKEEGGGKPPNDEIVFQGKTIRLNRADYGRWKMSYSAIPDINAALQTADDYYTENPPNGGKWFFPVSRWLAKDHEYALADNTPDDPFI